jgi:hypothetical protein
MAADLPEGYVDPRDLPRVTAIVAAVVGATGVAGVLQLLARIPGIRIEEGTPRRFLRAEVPPAAWLGPENQLVVDGDGLVHRQVVGGITLHRARLTRADLPAVVARLIAATVADAGSVADASAALTAMEELFST